MLRPTWQSRSAVEPGSTFTMPGPVGHRRGARSEGAPRSSLRLLRSRRGHASRGGNGPAPAGRVKENGKCCERGRAGRLGPAPPERAIRCSGRTEAPASRAAITGPRMEQMPRHHDRGGLRRLHPGHRPGLRWEISGGARFRCNAGGRHGPWRCPADPRRDPHGQDLGLYAGPESLQPQPRPCGGDTADRLRQIHTSRRGD